MNPFLFFPWLGTACIFLLVGLVQFVQVFTALTSGDIPKAMVLGIFAMVCSIIGLTLALTLLRCLR